MPYANIFIRVLTVTLFSLSLLCAPNAFALGKLGHQLTCELAVTQLSPQAEQKLNTLLGTMKASEVKRINQYTYQKTNAKMTLAKACTWADAIKKESHYDTFKSWHFINVARNNLNVSPNSCQKNCVTSGIKTHQQQLASSTSNQEKLEALLFLGHWLGDIHQPLHVSFASDLGGNKTEIASSDNKCTNLHWLWDQCLLTRQIDTKDHQARYQFLLTNLSQRLKQAKSSGQTDMWVNTTVYDWANESLRIATRSDFGYCQMNNGVCNTISHNKQTLNANYQQTFAPILNQQIVKASVRLAHLLEMSL